MVMGGHDVLHCILGLPGQTQRTAINIHRLINNIGKREYDEHTAQPALRRYLQQMRHDCGCFARANRAVASKDALVRFDFPLPAGAINILSQLQPM